jgi:hypothetical protein
MTKIKIFFYGPMVIRHLLTGDGNELKIISLSQRLWKFYIWVPWWLLKLREKVFRIKQKPTFKNRGIYKYKVKKTRYGTESSNG